MADPVLSANGQAAPFPPAAGRLAGGGGGGGAPLAESPREERPGAVAGWRQPAEAVRQEGRPEEAQGGSPAATSQDCDAGEEEEEEQRRQVGKKKHRRRPSKKKRHWKPYYKLSWEEKKKFDEKQSQRASRLRAEMFAKGQPVAPYNTTQFLMEDHDQEEPDLKRGLPPKRAAKSDDTSEEDCCFAEEEGGGGGSDGMGGGGDGGGEFLQKDFSETYERYHVESLQNMSKQELIQEYLELEKCLSRMEEENNRLRGESKKLAGGEAQELRARQLEQELDRLRAENQKLSKEAERSRQQEKPLPKAGE